MHKIARCLFRFLPIRKIKMKNSSPSTKTLINISVVINLQRENEKTVQHVVSWKIQRFCKQKCIRVEHLVISKQSSQQTHDEKSRLSIKFFNIGD